MPGKKINPKPTPSKTPDDEDRPIPKRRKTTTLICRGDWRHAVETAQRQRKDFYYTATNSTVVVKSGKCRYIYNQTGESYNYRMFTLFRKVKNEVLRNIKEKELSIPTIRSTDVDYYAYAAEFHNVTEEQVYEDIWELDINMAYYNAAHALGYISREFYEECKTLDKKTRLRLIGSIAILKTKYIYEHGRLKDVQVANNPVLRSVWFNICRYVAEAMRDMAKILNKDFMFFWVDGIVFRGEANVGPIADFAYLKYGFDFKILKMDKIRVEKEATGIVRVKLEGQKDHRPAREFYLDTNRQQRALDMLKDMNKILKAGKIKPEDLEFLNG